MPSLRHIKLQGISQLRIARRQRTRLDSRNRSQTFTRGNPIQGFIMFAACIDRRHNSDLRLKGFTSVA